MSCATIIMSDSAGVVPSSDYVKKPVIPNRHAKSSWHTSTCPYNHLVVYYLKGEKLEYDSENQDGDEQCKAGYWTRYGETVEIDEVSCRGECKFCYTYV